MAIVTVPYADTGLSTIGVIPAEDFLITRDKKTGKEIYNTSFQFRVEQTAEEYNPAFNELEEESEDNRKFIPVARDMGGCTFQRPTYKLSPERPASFALQKNPFIVKDNNVYRLAV